DWSSDVCSSDLVARHEPEIIQQPFDEEAHSVARGEHGPAEYALQPILARDQARRQRKGEKDEADEQAARRQPPHLPRPLPDGPRRAPYPGSGFLRLRFPLALGVSHLRMPERFAQD